jgi:hypothetical protein
MTSSIIRLLLYLNAAVSTNGATQPAIPTIAVDAVVALNAVAVAVESVQ